MQKQNWIWLDPCRYADRQRIQKTLFCGGDSSVMYIADFEKNYCLDKKIRKVTLNISADTHYRFFINGDYTGEGPAVPGGDFGYTTPLETRYYETYTIEPDSIGLRISVEVRLGLLALSDVSHGQGGLNADGVIYLDDGEIVEFCTDESWLSRPDMRYNGRYLFEDANQPEGWHRSKYVTVDCTLKLTPIPNLTHTVIKPQTCLEITAGAGVSEHMIYFDRIYTANVQLKIQTSGSYSVCLECFEKEPGENSSHEFVITGKGNLNFVSQELFSVGGMKLRINNLSGSIAIIRPTAYFCCYPVEQEGSFRCSDAQLNKIYDVCKWTLMINRQTYHLDSPLHQEPLACTGDYYIESLMEAMCFGDMRLAEFDLEKTAELLVMQKGRMFHATYSLIWVLMLEAVYCFTGNDTPVQRSEKAIEMLLNEFGSYIGETGLIEAPPSFMFVDWIVVDGLSMHHPPKCLGQTVMCCFYYAALRSASRLFELIGRDGSHYEKSASDLKNAVNSMLFDEKRDLYFDGLNIKYSSDYCYLPENTDRRYYSVHSNSLAVLFDICPPDKSAGLMESVLNNSELIQPQPYFMHYVIEAVCHAGLFDKYGVKLISRWKPVVEEFDKGLAEGWYKPEKGYHFDHSHAWGGTPAYQLPMRFSGLKLLQPGFRRISLSPKTFGLDFVDLEIPTPYGMIRCSLKKGGKPEIRVPEGIEWYIEK